MLRRYGFRLKRIKKQETAADITETKKRNEVANQVIKEMTEKYPIITADNFKEVDNFRVTRTAELMGR